MSDIEQALELSPIDEAGNKVDQICSALTQMAKQIGPRARLPSVSQLRAAMRVSTSTLDRALSELESRNVIEREHGRGIFVSPALRVKTIGILMEINPILPRTSPYYALLIEHACLWAERRYYGVAMYLNLPHDHGLELVRQRLIYDVQTGQVDAVLVAGATNFDQIRWLQQHGIPCVYRGCANEPGYNVEGDTAMMVDLGVRELARRGCRRIGHIGHDDSRFDGADSRAHQALLKSLAAVGLEYRPQWCKRERRSWQERVSPDAPTHEELGRNAMLEIWQRFEGAADHDRPDGLLITDDMLTRGALVGMHRLGLKPGKDLLIATAHNRRSPMLACYRDDLILIEYDVAEVADAMLGMLDLLMNDKTPPQRNVLIRPRLRVD